MPSGALSSSSLPLSFFLPMVLVEPSRFFADIPPSSSNQLLDLVASRRELSSETSRSASKIVLDLIAASFSPAVALVLDEAVTTAVVFFLRRLIRCPDSSSEEEKSLSSSLLLAGGGVAGRLRRLALPFAPRFLKRATGAAGAVSEVRSVSAMLSGRPLSYSVGFLEFAIVSARRCRQTVDFRG